jgi:hypothetical protein
VQFSLLEQAKGQVVWTEKAVLIAPQVCSITAA